MTHNRIGHLFKTQPDDDRLRLAVSAMATLIDALAAYQRDDIYLSGQSKETRRHNARLSDAKTALIAGRAVLAILRDQ